MQGFYISNRKNDGTIFEKVKKILKEHENIPVVPGFQLKMFYNNSHLSYYERNGDFIANNGVFIYKDNFNKIAIKIFYEDIVQGGRLNDLLLKAHGQFFLVIYLKGKLMVITDRFATIPVYMLRWKNIIEISNIYYLLTYNNAVNYSKNLDYLAQGLSWDNNNEQISTGGTLFNEISYLKPGCIYNFERGESREEVYYDIKENINFGKYTNYKQILENLVDILDSNYKFLNNIEKIFCGITGGFDTRLNLSTLLKKNKQFKCGNDILDRETYLKKGRYSDGEITKQIVKTYKLDFINVGKNTESVTKWIQENKGSLNVIKNARFGTMHRMYYFNFVSKISNIELSGLAGSELMTKAYHFYYRKKEKFNIREFAKTQRYIDILSDKFYTRERYYATLENYFANLIDNIFYSTRGDLLGYLFYTTGYMNMYNNYLGSANMLCPVYTPFLEPDFIKLMMEIPYKLKGFHKIHRYLYRRMIDKELREIDTTHGYPATVVKLSNFYRFLRLLNPIEPNLTDKSLFDRARSFYISHVRRVFLPYVHRRLRRFLGLSKIDTSFNSVVEKDNPLRIYLDVEKISNRLINNNSREMVNSFAQKLKPYLEK